jgi:hypothetical protein
LFHSFIFSFSVLQSEPAAPEKDVKQQNEARNARKQRLAALVAKVKGASDSPRLAGATPGTTDRLH